MDGRERQPAGDPTQQQQPAAAGGRWVGWNDTVLATAAALRHSSFGSSASGRRLRCVFDEDEEGRPHLGGFARTESNNAKEGQAKLEEPQALLMKNSEKPDSAFLLESVSRAGPGREGEAAHGLHGPCVPPVVVSVCLCLCV